MKSIIAGIVVIIALAALLSVTPAYAPCIEGPGINCNGYPTQTLIQIKSDMLNYTITDKPHITMDGTPHIAVHLEVDDASSNIMSEHDLSLSSYGNASYALDISSYKPGVYSAIATSLMSQVTTSFAVGLVTTGPIITLNVAKNTYVQGDFITITGTVGPDDVVQLSLIDPNDNVVTSIQTISNNIGQYSTSALRIPINAISGTWKITADHNTSHTTLKILVQSLSSNDVIKNSNGIASPLEQFRSGIHASDVQCTQSLELVIKAEDGYPACVKFSTATMLIKNGWASSESGISSDGQRTYIIQDSSASSIPCDTAYPQSNTGIAVLYMPANATGKLCINYSNPNSPRSVDVRIFESQHLSEDTKDIQVLSSQDNIPQGNSTIVYTLKTGKVGFYGLTLFCYGTPLAVGYDNQSRIVTNDFPWLGQTFYCPMQTYTFHISGLSGMGVKYIPYP